MELGEDQEADLTDDNNHIITIKANCAGGYGNNNDQFHVTGTQYIRTDKVQSRTLNTGGTAERYFRPGQQARGVFYNK